MTGGWTSDELQRIGEATELRIQTARADGTLRNPIPIWHTHVGDAIYIRSAHGPDNGWFRRAKTVGKGRIQAGGVERDVRFEQAGPELSDDITASLHAKYDRYGSGPVGAITGADVLETTLRVNPLSDEGRADT